MSAKLDRPGLPAFPRTVFNRPALDRILYRVGDYASFREHLLDELDRARPLSRWTHRSPDDPGIALLEGAATVAEILSFYQTLYANEAYLRTASWRESVAALVALTGYRLAPGVGGEARFAIAVKSDEPVVVPKGFGFKAELEGADAPARFESVEPVTAHEALNEFSLFRPRLPRANINAGTTELELHSVGGSEGIDDLEAYDIRAGDRLMLVPETTVYDAGGGVFSPSRLQPHPEILIVAEVEQVLDRIIIRFDGSLRVGRGTTVRAYRIERTFRHFGFNAPRTIGIVDDATGIMAFQATEFVRDVWKEQRWFGDDRDYYSRIEMRDMPLDTEVDDLATGSSLICEGYVDFRGTAQPRRFTVVREIVDVRPDSVTWGGLTGGISVVELGEPLITNIEIGEEAVDIRQLRLHETSGPEIRLRAPTRWQPGSFGLDTALCYYGARGDALRLAGRLLLLDGPDDRRQSVRVTSTVEDFPPAIGVETTPRMWRIHVDQPPDFPREAFGERDNLVSVYGNLVDTNQGETQKPVVLGSGDAREAFQTFELPKPPLTYHLDPAQEPAQVAALDIFVEGRLWRRVDTFYSSAPQDPVYVVREDEDGRSFVQFGDGKTGMRLPSGQKNVEARYRSGSGARGALETDTAPRATGKLRQLTETWLGEPVVGGGDPETDANARIAAPGRMQTLGRMVGLDDYEAEARSIPGVLKAKVAWVAPAGSPVIQVIVLTEGSLPAEAAKVQQTMRTYNRCRGAARHPIVAVQGFRQYLFAGITVAYAADRRAEDMRTAVLAALGVVGDEASGIDGRDGLFGIARRQFGQGAHVSQLLGCLQQIDGVSWARSDSFEPLPPGTPPASDPLAIPRPAAPARFEAIPCATSAVLALHATHLDLALVLDATTGECET